MVAQSLSESGSRDHCQVVVSPAALQELAVPETIILFGSQTPLLGDVERGSSQVRLRDQHASPSISLPGGRSVLGTAGPELPRSVVGAQGGKSETVTACTRPTWGEMPWEELRGICQDGRWPWLRTFMAEDTRHGKPPRTHVGLSSLQNGGHLLPQGRV